jgi:hypothetical protein
MRTVVEGDVHGLAYVRVGRHELHLEAGGDRELEALLLGRQGGRLRDVPSEGIFLLARHREAERQDEARVRQAAQVSHSF